MEITGVLIEKDEGTPVEEKLIKWAFIEENAEGALRPKIWIERVLDEKDEGTPAKREKLTEGIFVENKVGEALSKKIQVEGIFVDKNAGILDKKKKLTGLLQDKSWRDLAKKTFKLKEFL